jgi:pimeloyl-ACP methyl ester carboxylesterase
MPRDPSAHPSPCPKRFPTREAALEYCARVYPGFTREYMTGQLAYGELGEDGSVVPPSPASRRRLLRWDRDFWADLAAARPPMLLVYGSQSHFFSPSIIEAMRKAKNDLSVAKIDGATHYLPMTHMGETLNAIKAFMSHTTTLSE